jgi:hypothetical protein
MKTKFAIVTVTIGEKYTKLSKITHPSIKKYAEKIGCDFIVISETRYSIPHYSKCEIKKLLDIYDRICYIDTDIIIHPDAHNIFDVVPENKLGMFEETPYFPNMKSVLVSFLNKNNIPLPQQICYYNTGVIVASKQHKNLFEDPDVIEDNFYEQTYLNSNIVKNNFEICSLDFRFNRQYGLNDKIPEHYLYSYFVHYAGVLFHQNEKDVFIVIENDLESWNKGQFSNKKCIHVLNIGNYFPKLTSITLPLIQQYAKRIGANLNIITERKYPEYPITYEKMQVYHDGKDYNWNILMDLDLLVDPQSPDITLRPKDKVYTQYIFRCSDFFEADKYFIRDGRDTALCAFFVITTDLTHDLWEPLNGEYIDNQHKTKRQHIIDEYCISNNMAKYGLKHAGIGYEEYFKHLGATTDIPNNEEMIMKQANEFLNDKVKENG